MIELIFIAKFIIVSFIVQFILRIFKKYELFIYWSSITDNNYLRKLLLCNFCLGFWFGWLVSFVFFISNGDIQYLLVAPFVAVLIWLMN